MTNPAADSTTFAADPIADLHAFLITPMPRHEHDRQIDAWIKTAAHHKRREDHYLALLRQIGQILGKSAYVADDYTQTGDVIVDKLPDLLRARLGVSPHLSLPPSDTTAWDVT